MARDSTRQSSQEYRQSDENEADGESVDGPRLARRGFMQAASLAAASGFTATVSAEGENEEDGEGEDPATILVPKLDDLSYWEFATFCCLEGLANRDGPQVFNYYPDKSDESWYDEYPVPERRVFYEWYQTYPTLEFDELDDPYDLVERLDPFPAEGYVVVDEGAPITVNVAANYAGSEDLLPVTASMLEGDVFPDLEVVYDLRSEHRGANFRDMSRVEVYQWAYEHQWPDANQARVANLGTPTRDTEPAIDISEYTADADTIYLKFADADPSDGAGTQLHEVRILRDGGVVAEIIPTTDGEADHLVENTGTGTGGGRQIRWCGFGDYWIYEVSGVQGAEDLELVLRNEWEVSIATAQDGPYEVLTESLQTDFGQPVTKFGTFQPPVNFFYTSNRARDVTVAEGGFFMDLTSNQGASQAEYQLKDTILSEMEDRGIVYGWHTDRGSEGQHISHLSQHGQLSIGASTYAANFSFHKEVDPPGDAVRRFKNRAEKPPTTENVDDKVYLTIVISDGDSLNFLMRKAQGGQWLLPERGEIPIGWEMAPLLADIGPGILDYFQATATPNDRFVGGPSGLAYFYPGSMPEEDLLPLLEESRDAFDRIGLHSTTVMKSGGDTPSQYEEILGDQITGVMDGYVRSGQDEHLFGEHDLGPDNGNGRLPIQADQATAYLPTALPAGHGARGSVEDLLGPLQNLVDRRGTRPLFVPIHVTAHSLTVAHMVELVDRLEEQYPDTFEVVGPDEFNTLFAKARAGSVVFEPPEGIAPSDLVLVDGIPNRLTPTLQAFGDEPVDVDISGTLEADGAETAIGSTSTTIEGGSTSTVEYVVDPPSTGVDAGTVQFTVDDGHPGDVSLPARFIDWPGDVDRPEWVANPSVYEAEAANHKLGGRVDEPDASNGVAWRTTYDPSTFNDTDVDHMVWQPTTDQNEAGSYIALFRMKVANNTIDETVATLDVVENVPFGDPAFFVPEGVGPSMDVRATDFDAADEYQWFGLPFEKPINGAKASEIGNYLARSQTQYRVDYDGHTAVTVDRIFVVEVPSS